jgi:uncharacterized peroxidase-related enzyme
MTYHFKELSVLSEARAAERPRELMEKTRQQLGFVPNMYGVMANEPAMFEAYVSGYGAFRKESGFTPVEQEVIFLAVSRANGCEYCMAAHSLVAEKMTRVPADVTQALRDGQPIGDAKLAALAGFTRRMVEARGRPEKHEIATFLAAGYSERNILGIIFAIGIKTLSNYTNEVFRTPLDPVFAGWEWKAKA